MAHQFGRGGLIQGVVAEDGVVKADSPVFLYERNGGKFVAKTRTESDGSFAFRDLNRESSDYLVVALDPDGVSPKNALVYDRVQPVNDVAGSTWSLNWLCLAKARSIIGIAAIGEAYQRHIPAPAYAFATTAGYARTNYSGSVAEAASVTPGWPELAALQFTTSRYWFYPYPGGHCGWFKPRKGAHGSCGGDRPQFCLEAVPVLSTTAAHGISIELTRAAGYPNAASGAGYCGTAFCVEFTAGATRFLNVWMHTSAYSYQISNSINMVNTTYCSKVLALNITSLGTGAKHFVVNIDFGGDIQVFADGVLIHTFSVASLIVAPPPTYQSGAYAQSELYALPKGLIVGGIYPAVAASGTAVSSDSYVTSGTLGVAVVYEELLDQDQVTAHYTALMLTTLKPVFSGYRKRVIESKPVRYWDMQVDEGADVVHETFRRADSAASFYEQGFRGAAQVAGPISGEKSIYVKPGQSWFSLKGGTIVNKSKLTIEAWVKKAPGKVLGILTMGKAENSVNWLATVFQFYVQANGNLAYVERTFVSTSEFTNTYQTTTNPIPDSVWTHVVARINTATNRLEVYINGALLAEDIVTSSNATDFMDQLSSGDYLRVTGFEMDAAMGGLNLVPYGNHEGGLAHVALYSRKLTATEILEHYQNIDEA